MEKSKMSYIAAVFCAIAAAAVIGTYMAMGYNKTLFAALASITLIGTLALLLLGLKFRMDEKRSEWTPKKKNSS